VGARHGREGQRVGQAPGFAGRPGRNGQGRFKPSSRTR
jgi:hypothetical protein